MDGVNLSGDRPITLAILAMGGQGGGVLADWVVAMAEREGWVAQTTSVPGVAQRTGATIYYVELIRPRGNSLPVLSLMPVPGDVDVVVASELMEAGRAIQRGLVTPERTVMVASTHRALTVPEKAKPGDGTIDGRPVLEAMHFAARKLIATDMQALAEANGSVISASLFGALASSGALPFSREAFETTIREGGVGVATSLAAFDAGFKAEAAPAEDTPAVNDAIQGGTTAERARLASFLERIDKDFPADARTMLRHGVARLVDYQDLDYAAEYLDHVGRLATVEPSLATEAARQVAVAMAYDDVIRVADLKTRAARLRARAARGAGARRPGAGRDRVHASARCRGLWHAAGALGQEDRGVADAFSTGEAVVREAASCAHHAALGFPATLSGRGHAALAPQRCCGMRARWISCAIGWTSWPARRPAIPHWRWSCCAAAGW